MSRTPPPAVSVVIACYTEERWPQLTAAVESALNQSTPPSEVIVVVDHNDELESRVARQWPAISVLANVFGQGASGSRNTGASKATGELIAFLDDDAVAEPQWLENLLEPFADRSVVGVGGGVTAAWEGSRPPWFPDEFAWVIGVSYRGLPEETAEIRNVWAENMAVRADRFNEVGGFRLNFGKVGSNSSPEDTDLCIRMAENGGRWLHVPAARVAHHVPVERSTFRFFVRRCFVEGQGKAALSALVTGPALQSERDYTRRIVPLAVARGIRDALVQRSFHPAARSFAVMTGLFAAGAGFVRGKLVRSS